MSAERFDIVATCRKDATKDDVPQMLQALLAERFGLKVHRESKEQSVYALIVGKGGMKMKEAVPEAPCGGGCSRRSRKRGEYDSGWQGAA